MKLSLTYEFDSETEMRAHLSASEKTDAPAPAPAPTASEKTDAPAPAPTEDADGMPYDAAVHADPPGFTKEGLWRSKRGFADEAKAARAAFKAGGGDVTPPVVPAMPGQEVSEETVPPVSLQTLLDRINEMLSSGAISEDALGEMYTRASGVSAAESFAVFQTNESARAALYAELEAI